MRVATFEIPLGIELLAAALGGLQGALFAAAHRDRRVDVLGVVIIGLSVALGGSLLRDVVLDQPPVVIWANSYLLVAASAAVLGMTLQQTLTRAEWPLTVLDAIVMGLFGAIATSKALSLGVGDVGALVVGVIGSIGGGVLRDILMNRPVSVLHVGTLYAVAAAAGAAALIVLVALSTPILIAGAGSATVTVAVRLAAVRRDWTFPEQGSMRLRRRS
ncbi:hypothetical protein G5V58_15090 [Nocardioides anomalus]|uniref:Glycine transporter domain-containing protein n=1 Tax=Nocardioides anomalus TaxID=2712223 RepID=A0A6G6WFI4_9ACTN|nr:TRIC cation channel family protein [Nocardioides anomalus]QIG43917.1 hypothetical protein G5V58_15090 [Nocardioides anomalus]